MKNKLKLILPSKKYLASFDMGMKEFRKEKNGNNSAESSLKYFKKKSDFPNYYRKTLRNRKGINLPKGFVPQTTLWAMVSNKFVGRLNIRHRLNKHLRTIGGHIGFSVIPSERRKGYATEMLRLGFKKARALGIKKALVTCDEINIGSRRVIEKNGGVLQNKVKAEGVYKLRFWVPTK